MGPSRLRLTVGIVTVARSDFGIYEPVYKALQASERWKPKWLVSGMHLSKKHGNTRRDIESAGFTIDAEIPFTIRSDKPEDISEALGLGVAAFARYFAQDRPDLLMVLGDRYEMITAALAALPLKIPVAHLHGGEITEGAFDDSLRHCLTKLSHLHFVSTKEAAVRVRQLGEESWRIIVSGAPALDHLHNMTWLSKAQLEKKLCKDLVSPILVVTFHPTTLDLGGNENALSQAQALAQVLAMHRGSVIVTAPNADPYSESIGKTLKTMAEAHVQGVWVDNLGLQSYWSLLKIADAMVGNSSSGLLEAPSFYLPVVNIGDRQKGRLKAKNVIDVGYSSEEVQQGLTKALSLDFKRSLEALQSPFGDGHASKRIVEKLESVVLGNELLRKKFADLPENLNAY